MRALENLGRRSGPSRRSAHSRESLAQTPSRRAARSTAHAPGRAAPRSTRQTRAQPAVHIHSRPIRSDNAPRMIWPGMPTTLTSPSAQAATSGEKPISIEIFRLVHLHGIPGNERAENSRPRSTRTARCVMRPRQRPFGGGPGRIDDVRRGCALAVVSGRAAMRRPAAVRCPRASSGRSSVSGAMTNSTSRPIAQHDARQPSVRMIVCSQGNSTIAPTPAPENAMLMARRAAAHEPVRQELRVHRVGHHVGAAADQRHRASHRDATALDARRRAAGQPTSGRRRSR